jgi:hypothetical protein
MIKYLNRGVALAALSVVVVAGVASCGEAPPATETARIPTELRSETRNPNTTRSASTSTQRRSLADAETPDSNGARVNRSGRFVVRRLPARDPRNIKTRDSGFLEEVVKDMERTIGPRLPIDVPVSFAELGQANAFYSPKERSITVSYELLDQIIILFLKSSDRDDPQVAAKVAQRVVDTLSFVFYHEAAHAMIDLDNLPITGREEDAADQLATVMIVTSAQAKQGSELKKNGITRRAEGGAAAINGALFFLLSSQSEEAGVQNLPFWDEHSLSQQRFYNILTWVYGSDPDKYEYLVQQKVLPASRAERGPGEYNRMLSAWQRILGDAKAI